MIVREEFDLMRFGFAHGVVLFHERREEPVVSVRVLTRQDVVVWAGKGVGEAILRGARFTFWRTGTGGELRVTAVGFDSAIGRGGNG